MSMKPHIKENLLWIWFGFFVICVILYIMYVIQTADRKPGCFYYEDVCVSSHTEERTYWQGGFGKMPGHWVTSETSVCDDWETVKVDDDCVTYHWFWGDHKNY